MRISESAYKCPYPEWVLPFAIFLSFCIAAVILSSATDFGFEAWWNIALVISFGGIMLAVFCGAFPLLGMTVYGLLLAGSVSMAFHDSAVIGWGYTVLLTPLLVPQCHTLALAVCFFLRERKKMCSLVGREGTLTSNVNVCRSIIEIDGEEFDAVSSHLRHEEIKNLPEGATIVVVNMYWLSLDVKLKPPEGQQTTWRGWFWRFLTG
jgi:membrane-bound ClpP family serine protease